MTDVPEEGECWASDACCVPPSVAEAAAALSSGCAVADDGTVFCCGSVSPSASPSDSEAAAALSGGCAAVDDDPVFCCGCVSPSASPSGSVASGGGRSEGTKSVWCGLSGGDCFSAFDGEDSGVVGLAWGG